MKTNYLFILFTLSLITNIYCQNFDATLLELNLVGGSNAKEFIGNTNEFYFTASDGIHGNELWYSDGTNDGTYLVKDIREGSASSDSRLLGFVDNILFFSSDDGIHGFELWKSDGTAEGTVLVKDIQEGNNNFNTITDLIEFDNKAYFTARNEENGDELWVSDGTEEGTFILKDINPGSQNSLPLGKFIYNNKIFFTAFNPDSGLELWTSDGTENGTSLFLDINPNGNGFFTGSRFVFFQDEFYFFANDGVSSFELWKSDGTVDNTQIVKDINEGSSLSSSNLFGAVINDMLIFTANNGINGVELWKTDGTEIGTQILTDINSTNTGSVFNIFFKVLNNNIYFMANDGMSGLELWRSNGTESGTVLVSDITEGPESSFFENIHVDTLNQKLLFFTSNIINGPRSLWISDGTSQGTIEEPSIRASNSSNTEENFFTINGITIMTGENESNNNEFWAYNGNSIVLFKELNRADGADPDKFVSVNNTLFFRARNGGSGKQLYSSNGTSSTTKLVKNINENGFNAIDDESETASVNGILYFSANDGDNGYELWRSDGTGEGTFLVKDIYQGSQSGLLSSNGAHLFDVVDNIIYFFANDGIHGYELWRSDGTEEGTFMLKDLRPGGINSGSFPQDFVSLNGSIYFRAFDGTITSLWRTDGTESGTVQVFSLNDMRILRKVNNQLIMIAETSGTTYGPHDVWVSDGTSLTQLGSYGDGIDSDIRFTTILNDEFYFVVKDPITFSKAIYKTNGTVQGTSIVYNTIDNPIVNADIDNIIACGDYIYFGVQQELSGFDKELWRTAGNIESNTLISSGDTEDFLFHREYTCFDTSLLYLAESSPNGIWFTNGGLLNTPSLIEFNIINDENFNEFDRINGIGVNGNQLYFNGLNDISGAELYIVDVDFSVLSLDENEDVSLNNNLLVKIFPNPPSKVITLQFKNNISVEEVTLYDIIGKKVSVELNVKQNNSAIMDVSNLSKGVYIVNVKTNTGNVQGKIIIN